MSTPLDWNLRSLLKGASVVLDLGAGGMNGALYCDPAATYIGIDVVGLPIDDWPRVLRERPGNTQYYEGDIRQTEKYVEQIEPDVVLMLDVIEHLHKPEGETLFNTLLKAWPNARWGIFTPDGFHPNPGFDDPDHPQFHRSGWVAADFEALGFKTLLMPNFHADGTTGLYAWR